MSAMLKLSALLLCLAFLAAAGGAVVFGMALGAVGFGLGALTLVQTAWLALSRD